MVKDTPNAFWCRQYDNLNNMHAYQGFAEQLIHLFGDDLILVGTVGSGGSTSGTITYLREKNPNIRMVVVDTFGSILFGLPEGKRELRGLGHSLQPKNLKHELYDEIHWVKAQPAYAATRELHRRHAVYAGITTGAAYLVAKAIAAEAKPNQKVVFIGPDDGVRYAKTVYSDKWLADQGYSELSQPDSFSHASSLSHAAQLNAPWIQIDWGRTPIAQMAGVAK
jgi:cysteine synthase A